MRDWLKKAGQLLVNILISPITLVLSLIMGNQHDSLDDNQQDRPSALNNPYEEMNQKDRIQLVRRIVDELPEKQRTCIQLRDFEGKSYKEVAEIMLISEDQVKINIFRGRQTIKQRFKELDDYGL